METPWHWFMEHAVIKNTKEYFSQLGVRCLTLIFGPFRCWLGWAQPLPSTQWFVADGRAGFEHSAAARQSENCPSAPQVGLEILKKSISNQDKITPSCSWPFKALPSPSSWTKKFGLSSNFQWWKLELYSTFRFQRISLWTPTRFYIYFARNGTIEYRCWNSIENAARTHACKFAFQGIRGLAKLD